MRQVQLQRTETSDQGTFGKLITDCGSEYCAGELPERNNQSGISCIPAGTYYCLWQFSPKHGLCYHVLDVPGRSDIEIHVANFVGDVNKGLKSDLLGCITLGMSIGILDGQKAIISSRGAVSRFQGDMLLEEFQLVISENFSA